MVGAGIKSGCNARRYGVTNRAKVNTYPLLPRRNPRTRSPGLGPGPSVYAGARARRTRLCCERASERASRRGGVIRGDVYSHVVLSPVRASRTPRESSGHGLRRAPQGNPRPLLLPRPDRHDRSIDPCRSPARPRSAVRGQQVDRAAAIITRPGERTSRLRSSGASGVYNIYWYNIRVSAYRKPEPLDPTRSRG